MLMSILGVPYLSLVVRSPKISFPFLIIPKWVDVMYQFLDLWLVFILSNL